MTFLLIHLFQEDAFYLLWRKNEWNESMYLVWLKKVTQILWYLFYDPLMDTQKVWAIAGILPSYLTADL